MEVSYAITVPIISQLLGPVEERCEWKTNAFTPTHNRLSANKACLRAQSDPSFLCNGRAMQLQREVTSIPLHWRDLRDYPPPTAGCGTCLTGTAVSLLESLLGLHPEWRKILQWRRKRATGKATKEVAGAAQWHATLQRETGADNFHLRRIEMQHLQVQHPFGESVWTQHLKMEWADKPE